MEDACFDAWTRRRFGTAAAGAFAGLLALAREEDARAKRKKKRRKSRKKPRPRKCEKLRTRCNPNNEKKLCCGGLLCGINSELGGHHCCHDRYASCQENADCCANMQCVGDSSRFCDIPAAAG
jgi:hypothetical protein